MHAAVIMLHPTCMLSQGEGELDTSGYCDLAITFVILQIPFPK